MRKRFLTSGAMIVSATITLSAGLYNDNPWSIYSMDNDPIWKQARIEENYWAMVRRYNRK